MRVVLVGAGGHARVVLDAARAAGHDVIAAIDADLGRRGAMFDGIRIVGDEREIPRLRSEGVEGAILGVGSVGITETRALLFTRVAAAGLALPVVRHPSSVVAGTSSLGDATVVFAGVVVNPGAAVGRNVILNTGALIEHDCRIGDHVHVSPGARLAGGVLVGEGAHIGIGAVVIQGLRVGRNALVAAGAVVVRDVEEGARVAGVPARQMATTG